MEETCAIDKADPTRLQAAEMGGKVSQLGEDGAAVGQPMPQCNGDSAGRSSSEAICEGVISVTESAGHELVSSTDIDNDSVRIPPQHAGHPPPVAGDGSGSTDPGIICAGGADNSAGDRYNSARSADVDSGPSSADYQMVSIVDVCCGINLQDSDGATTAAGDGDAPRGINVPSQSTVEDSSSDTPHTPGHPLPPSPTSTPSPFACDNWSAAALDPTTEEERNGITVIQVPADSPQMDTSVDTMDISDLSTMSADHRQLKRMRSGSSDYRINDETEDYCIVDFLDKSNNDAEARLAAKRHARAEAREIRMRELERQQNEAEETADKVYDIYNSDSLSRSSVRATPPRTPSMLVAANNTYHSSRRSSEDSLEELATSTRDVRVKYELKDVEEKFRKAMIANAQLDNEKAAAVYQVELFKDRFEELEESHSQLQKEHKDKCRLFEHLKRATAKLQEDLEMTREQLEERDRLIQEQGLVIVGGECVTSCDDSGGDTEKRPKRALVSAQVAGLLETLGEGSLDVRLKRFAEERNELMDELRHVKLELGEEQARSRGGQKGGLRLNGPCLEDDLEDIQREANKLVGDYKFKLQKAEQENSTLQATVARLETQVVRYKSAADTAEKVEDELKVEKRKLQRELREAQSRVEELETAHTHLQRRLDKLKNAKSALLKDL